MTKEILLAIGNDIADDQTSFDPATEDMIFGKDLEDGMIVLAERHQRVATAFPHEESPTVKLRLDTTNRWCVVTQLHVDRDRGQVYFIGLYVDGQKATRTSSLHMGWEVKLRLLPENPGIATPTYSMVPMTTFQKYQQGGPALLDYHPEEV